MQIALGAECSARRFFEHVAGTTPDPAVRCLAEEMAAEECEHEERVGRIVAGLPGEGPDQEFLPRAVEGPGAAPETERFSPRAPRPASKPLY
jgi:rubrerythrin